MKGYEGLARDLHVPQATFKNGVVYKRLFQYGGGLLASLGGVARAAEIDPVQGVVPRWGTTLDWSITMTLVLCVLILAGILLSRVLFRGRQTEGHALWVHLLTLGIMPLFLLVVGNFAVLEYAKEERNCSGCHRVLKAYVEDMQNPKSDSLAALHFQHRFAPGTSCYSCHTNYGVHGSVAGKLAGLGHALRYLAGQYQFPLKIAAPYSNTLCLKCHNGAKRFMARDEHLEAAGRISPALVNDQARCLDCHEVAHRVGREAEAARRTG